MFKLFELFFRVLGFELKASYLLGRHSAIWAMLPTPLWNFQRKIWNLWNVWMYILCVYICIVCVCMHMCSLCCVCMYIYIYKYIYYYNICYLMYIYRHINVSRQSVSCVCVCFGEIHIKLFNSAWSLTGREWQKDNFYFMPLIILIF
jgi:hypothetical protein